MSIDRAKRKEKAPAGSDSQVGPKKATWDCIYAGQDI